ncbi:MAG: hypothetical protein H5T84_10405 [Thermoleophilia bacterium]|nr:hypothetical protein [Thermoleophilia bacterium]
MPTIPRLCGAQTATQTRSDGRGGSPAPGGGDDHCINPVTEEETVVEGELEEEVVVPMLMAS